jgi:NAD(P)H-hydrate epimerase
MPFKVVTVEQMVAAEKAADEGGHISYDAMMENAGQAVADVVAALLPGEGARVAVLVGPGNNGGDGLVAARLLTEMTTAEVGAYLLKPRDDDKFQAAQQAGVFIANAADDQRWRTLRTLVGNADVVVDALLGTGIDLPLRENAAALLKNAAAALEGPAPEPALVWPARPEAPPTPSRAKVVAVDCPSGLNCNTGEADDHTLPADVTVTFAAAKVGHFKQPGAALVGALAVADIDIPERGTPLADVTVTLLDAPTTANMLPPRTDYSHKGTYGRSLIVAGSALYTGAVLLAGQAAYRSGAGLVELAVPEPLQTMLAGAVPEVIWRPLDHNGGHINRHALDATLEAANQADAVLIGPGLGQAQATSDWLHAFLTDFTTDAPLVLDADALNLLAASEGWPDLLPEGSIITPHPGEMGRLAGLSVSQVQADRLSHAQRFAAEWGVVLVLKGAHTLVAHPDGRVSLNPFATDALAVAGTGDVLAGCITGLVGQGATPFDAAAAGVYVHGAAGLHAAREAHGGRGVLASDVLANLAFPNV